MIRRFLAALGVLALLVGPASAQTALTFPAFKFNGPIGTATPTALLGFDSVTGLPCIVGQTATCAMPTSSSGGSSAPVVVTTTTTAGTITTGGTAQDASAANASRKGWCVTNNSALAEPLYVRAGGTASPTVAVPIPAGGQACNAPGLINQGAISVVAATTGHSFVSTESQ